MGIRDLSVNFLELRQSKVVADSLLLSTFRGDSKSAHAKLLCFETSDLPGTLSQRSYSPTLIKVCKDVIFEK